MLMDPDERAIDEDIFEIRIRAERFETPLPDSLLRPAPKARLDGEPPAERFRQVAPRRARARNPKNRFDEEPVVASAAARVTGFARQFRRDPLPLGRRSTSIESRLISIFGLESTFYQFESRTVDRP